MTVIKTKRLTLRVIERRDAARFAIVCNDRVIARNTARIPHPYTMRDAENFTDYAIGAFQEAREYAFAVCRKTEIIACVGVKKVEQHIFDLGYWVGAHYRGDGVACEAAGACVDFAFETLGARTITAGYFFDNPASGRVLEKLGFQPTGAVIKTPCIGRGGEVETVQMQMKR